MRFFIWKLHIKWSTNDFKSKSETPNPGLQVHAALVHSSVHQVWFWFHHVFLSHLVTIIDMLSWPSIAPLCHPPLLALTSFHSLMKLCLLYLTLFEEHQQMLWLLTEIRGILFDQRLTHRERSQDKPTGFCSNALNGISQEIYLIEILGQTSICSFLYYSRCKI